MFSEPEQHRMRQGMLVRKLSIHDWRAYFTYLLGRPVTLQETEMFLIAESEGAPHGRN